MKKKTYNPFKMWLSWICAVIGFVYSLYVIKLCSQNSYNGFLNILYPCVQKSDVIIFDITVISFLFGWGINSLMRKMRK